MLGRGVAFMGRQLGFCALMMSRESIAAPERKRPSCRALVCFAVSALLASCSLQTARNPPPQGAEAAAPIAASPLPPPAKVAGALPPVVVVTPPAAMALPRAKAEPPMVMARRRAMAAPPPTMTPVRPAPAAPLGPMAKIETISGGAEPPFHRVEVDFATNRTPSGKRQAVILFTAKPGPLVFGQAIVTIPFKHQPGVVEAPPWYDFIAPNSAEHFTIEHEAMLDATHWEAALRTATARSGRNAVLLFVHGYKNTFDEALFRTAQIAYDVHFNGAVAMFSWPSKDRLADYNADHRNAQLSVPDFESALRRVIEATHSDEIYIIAHSMGNQVVTRGLVELANQDPTIRGRVRELILAAPDIDAATFKQNIAPFLSRAAQRTTLYASSRDLALVVSGKLQGHVRAGDTSHGVIVVPPVQTVDATLANADLLGHSYVADSRSILGDIDAIINEHWSPLQRKLAVHHTIEGDYWVYDPH
jgi:esterase/lipase superfamily enzyme